MLDRHNNFDLIRLAAALQVAFLHSTEHLRVPLGTMGNFLEFFPGVPAFFFMSGMMVTASAMRHPLKDYAEARVRRIVPALWLAFAAAIIILLAFGQIGRTELDSPVLWAWIGSQLTVFQVFNPEMFRDFGVGTINGSLWTIPVEVGFYFLLPLLLVGSRGEPRRLTALFVVGAVITFFIGYAVREPQSLPLKIVSVTPLAHFWLFALGALTYLHLSRIKPLIARVHWAVPLIVFVGFSYLLRPVLPDIVGTAIAALMLCISILWLGMGAPVAVGILRKNDISYGLYVYHMLVVNCLVALGLMGRAGVGIAMAVALLLAWLSWRFIEEPILHHARRRPRTAVAQNGARIWHLGPLLSRANPQSQRF